MTSSCPYFHDAAQLAPDGLFLNLYDFDEQINFDAPYWDSRCAEDVSVAGKLYFTTGDLSLLTFDCTHCLIFNKKLMRDLGIEENPYQLVLDGEWTIDKLHEMAKQATYDSDGVTGMTYKDTWGMFINQNYATSLFIASGERLSRKDEDDMPIITVNSENAVRVMDKIVSLFSDKSSTILIESFATEATARRRHLLDGSNPCRGRGSRTFPFDGGHRLEGAGRIRRFGLRHPAQSEIFCRSGRL